jgi:hypothetical protein
MATVKKQTARLDQDGPLSIPTGSREAAHLHEGDTVFVEAADGGVLIRHIEPDQAGFWTPEWLDESARSMKKSLAARPACRRRGVSQRGAYPQRARAVLS